MPTTDGGMCNQVMAVRNGNKIEIELTHETEWILKKMGQEAKKIEVNGKKGIIYL